ncbi:hypothetical protein MRX96_042703 [Rhipicephalus microplus]
MSGQRRTETKAQRKQRVQHTMRKKAPKAVKVPMCQWWPRYIETHLVSLPRLLPPSLLRIQRPSPRSEGSTKSGAADSSSGSNHAKGVDDGVEGASTERDSGTRSFLLLSFPEAAAAR